MGENSEPGEAGVARRSPLAAPGQRGLDGGNG